MCCQKQIRVARLFDSGFHWKLNNVWYHRRWLPLLFSWDSDTICVRSFREVSCAVGGWIKWITLDISYNIFYLIFIEIIHEPCFFNITDFRYFSIFYIFIVWIKLKRIYFGKTLVIHTYARTQTLVVHQISFVNTHTRIKVADCCDIHFTVCEKTFHFMATLLVLRKTTFHLSFLSIRN